MYNIFKKLSDYFKDYKESRKIKNSLGHSTPINYNSYNIEDIQTLIRTLNLEISLGNIDITPDISRLDKETIEKCKKLSEKGMIIGGSVLLKACGLLYRECGDIDIFCDLQKAIKEKWITEENIINQSQDYFTGAVRSKVEIKGYGTLDIFEIRDEDEQGKPLSHLRNRHVYNIDGINFKDPIDTLEVKFGYYRPKEYMDFIHINNVLSKL